MKIIKVEPTQLKSSDLSIVREKIHKTQNSICPILKKEFPIENMVVDHLHKKHAKLLNLPNAGCVRGVIHRQANSFEGKISNLLVRLGLHKFGISLPELLRNTADYLEQKPYPFLHPSEKKKKKILKKTSYNKLKKVYKGKGKFPKYKVSSRNKNIQTLTKPFKMLFEQHNIKPEFYSK